MPNNNFTLQKEANELLHNILGYGNIKINFFLDNNPYTFIGDQILIGNKRKTLNLLKRVKEEKLNKLLNVLNFYRPRWIAYSSINLDEKYYYNEYAADNELLLGITSIIEHLSENKSKKCCSKCGKYIKGPVKQFQLFLKKNLSETEIRKTIQMTFIYKNGKRTKLKSLKDFSNYIYNLRSAIIHKMELKGIYPFNIDFDDWDNNNVYPMIQPKQFRKFLWKAILNHFNLKSFIKY